MQPPAVTNFTRINNHIEPMTVPARKPKANGLSNGENRETQNHATYQTRNPRQHLRGNSFTVADEAPKSAPLPRKVYSRSADARNESRFSGSSTMNRDQRPFPDGIFASAVDLRDKNGNGYNANRVADFHGSRGQIYASRSSLHGSRKSVAHGADVYGEYSEYGELRAIVRRIEAQHSNYGAPVNNGNVNLAGNSNQVARNQSFSVAPAGIYAGKSAFQRKRMNFDQNLRKNAAAKGLSRR